MAILNEAWIAFYSDYFSAWPPIWKGLMLSVCVCKLLRHSFRSSQSQWFILLCAHLLAFDLRRQNYEEPVLISWFFGNFIYVKISGWKIYRIDTFRDVKKECL